MLTKHAFKIVVLLWASAVPALAVTNLTLDELRNQTKRLPYGQSFTVSGSTGDIRVGTERLTDVITPDTVGGKYTVDGKDNPINPEPINGDAWKVTIGELKPDSSVTFTFQFSGKLNSMLADQVVRAVFGSPDFTATFQEYVQQATGKSGAEQVVHASIFGNTVSRLVLGELAKRNLTPKEANEFARVLFIPIAEQFSAVTNIPTDLDLLRNPGDPKQRIPGLSASSSIGQVYDVVSKIQDAELSQIPSNRIANVKTSISRFFKEYGVLTSNLKNTVVTALTVEVGVNAAGDVKDLEKYAGFDGGALYIPRLNELRSFATVSTYFLGPVELKTDSPESFWRQRLSLTFGVAVNDISGGDKNNTRISNQNAFLYGLGFRLNKYFRLTVGGVVYRTKLPAFNGVASPGTNSLRHEFVVGPSIDVTALPGLQSIFAKAKSSK